MLISPFAFDPKHPFFDTLKNGVKIFPTQFLLEPGDERIKEGNNLIGWKGPLKITIQRSHSDSL